MKRKKLMLLGGIRYLLPVIEAAHKLGVYVITADYFPDNIAHKYSDEYVNVSIIDRDAVLKVAQERQIDGILSFGVDPGVITAAYVAEIMGLPFPPLKSVEILQNKDRFRDFLADNGFNCPWHFGFGENDIRLERFLSDPQSLIRNPFPCIVKPVDSAGSKGCSRIDRKEDLSRAVECARSESHNGRIIIEQFLEKVGCSSDTDSFSIDNELVFCSFNCQHFDLTAPNPYTPASFSWPSDMPKSAQVELRGEIQRLIKLLNLGTHVYNIETRYCTDGKAYIMELSPRGGGNRLSEVLKFATGQDLIENNVRGALGMPLLSMSDPAYGGIWSEYIVHSNRAGVFRALDIDRDFAARHIVQNDLWVGSGDRVQAFTGANQTLGTLVLKFADQREAEAALADSDAWAKVIVRPPVNHYLPRVLDKAIIRQFMTDACSIFPNELGSLDPVAYSEKLFMYADCFCVGESSGTVRAALFAYLNDNKSKIGYITHICALPDSEKGVAYDMHEACCRIALNCGKTRIRLEVMKDNDHAIRFYKGLGYVIVEDRPCVNRWLMELVIDKRGV